MATTINKYSVGLSLDASDYIEKSKISAREAAKLNRAIESGRSPAENFSRGLDLLNKALEEGAIKLPVYNRLQDELAKKHKVGAYSAEELAKAEQKAADAARRLKEENARLAAEEQKKQAVQDRGKQITLSMLSAQEKHTRSLSEYNRLLKAGAIDHVTYRRAVEQSKKALNGVQAATVANTSASTALIGKMKGLAVAYLGVQTVSKSIKLATEVEDTAVAFEVLTGNAEQAKRLFQQVRDFSQASPVTFSNAAQATRTMMSFGVEAQQVQQNLKMLSDVTGGNNERFKNLSLAFSQMSAAGRLMGQDLLQMVNAGFNPLQQISKTTGESLIELKKRMEDGAISSHEVRQAFKDATAEGGMFAGMTDRLAGTMGGKLNIALSELEKAGAKAGEALGPLIIDLVDGFQENKGILEDSVFLIEKFADGIGFALAMVKDMANAAKNLDFDAEWTATNKLLDRTEQRDRDRAREAAKRAQEQKDKLAGIASPQVAGDSMAGVDARLAEVAKSEKAILDKYNEQIFALKLRNEELVNGEKAAKRMELRQAGFDDIHILGIEREREKIELIEKQAERHKRIAEIQKESAEAFRKNAASALEAAKKHFEIEKDKRKKIRDDVAQGPASMEVGSAEAAKFFADQANARIAAEAMPEMREPTQKEILAEAQKQFIEAQKQTALQEKQETLMTQMLTAFKENGFRRIR